MINESTTIQGGEVMLKSFYLADMHQLTFWQPGEEVYVLFQFSLPKNIRRIISAYFTCIIKTEDTTFNMTNLAIASNVDAYIDGPFNAPTLPIDRLIPFTPQVFVGSPHRTGIRNVRVDKYFNPLTSRNLLAVRFNQSPVWNKNTKVDVLKLDILYEADRGTKT